MRLSLLALATWWAPMESWNCSERRATKLPSNDSPERTTLIVRVSEFRDEGWPSKGPEDRRAPRPCDSSHGFSERPTCVPQQSHVMIAPSVKHVILTAMKTITIRDLRQR